MSTINVDNVFVCIYFSKKNNKEYIIFLFGLQHLDYIEWIAKISLYKDRNIDNVYNVCSSSSKVKGFGKIIYEFAMFYLWKFRDRSYLASDDFFVSQDALRIYKYYYDNIYNSISISINGINRYYEFLRKAYSYTNGTSILDESKYDLMIKSGKEKNLSNSEIYYISEYVYEK
jgi:hypothetical protein